jgi:uncharacterized membrane protein YgdD (TMEM256/DUF423 family)
MRQAWQYNYCAIAALLCAFSVAMSSYASHGLEGESQHRLFTASYFAFAHGLSVIALARFSAARSNLLACGLMLLGVFLFSGSLAGAALFHASTALAPAGGMALILAWCWIAVNFFRSREGV